jgi:hypothetical protein
MRRHITLTWLATAATLAASFAGAQTPAITGFTPRSGPPGTLVKIIGEHLDRANAVTFGGASAEFRIFGSTHLKATVPADATSGPIHVLRDGAGGTTGVPFEVVRVSAAHVFALGRPSPNPATESVAWSFTLPEAGAARLTVLDLRGAEVRVLARGPHAAGAHAGAWDLRDARGRRVRPGIYFVRLEGARRVAIARVAVAGS